MHTKNIGKQEERRLNISLTEDELYIKTKTHTTILGQSTKRAFNNFA